MAKVQKQEQSLMPDLDAQEALGPPKSYRLQITLGLVALILCQMTMMFLILPTRQASHNFGLDTTSGPGGFEETVTRSPMNLLPEEPTVEKPIKDGPFRIINVRNEVNEEFSLTIHVSIRKTDAAKFQKRYDDCTQQILARLTDVLNRTSPEERKGESGYAAIMEKIKMAINEVLGVPWVQEVFLTDVSYRQS